jgi:hypothetical protein
MRDWRNREVPPAMTDSEEVHISGIRCRGPEIAYHGGYCCGFKTIHTLGDSPNATVPAWKRNEDDEIDFDDVDAGGHRHDGNMFNDDAPEETALERVDRYLAWLKKRRPRGMSSKLFSPKTWDIDDDVYSDDVYKDCCQNSNWGPDLEKRGFRMVTSCYNSNSYNTIFVYHFAMGE